MSAASVREPFWVRLLLTLVALAFLAVALVAPLVAVFHQALKDGLALYFASFKDPNAWAAIRLSLVAAAVAVALNTIFGLAAAWLLARFRFRGKGFLTTLLDIPFVVSPVVAGLIFVLLFGAQGWFGPWLDAHDIRIVFALPGIILATTFVSLPFVAREILPTLQAQGTEEEEAARMLGASSLRTFWRVTLPNIRWALFSGIVLCTARALGEFGAVSVVSGHIRGETNTLPLHVEILYNEYQFTAAFACASLLTLTALVTLLLKSLLEWRIRAAARRALEIPS
ncbi:MAG: sulfate transporter permease subunit CysW [Holophagaceae bacterium]|nr:sulfate transporter permease subunit CysW [Holophagaceae bacterium]